MSPFERCVFALILLLAAGFCTADLLGDYREETSLVHLAMEGGVLVCALAGLGYLGLTWWRTRLRLDVARRDLLASRADLKKFQAETRDFAMGLGQAIDRQFVAWHLSEAEKEVGLLLLKGLSFKEIGQLRQTSERTVRQQAQALYGKAGLSGRIEFAAFFLEDLLLPPSASS